MNPPILPASPLAARWTARLQEMWSAQERDPSGFGAWRARAGMRSLLFLMARYGDESQVFWHSARRWTAPLPDDIFNGVGRRPLRTRREMRARLDHISDANEARHRSEVKW